MEFFRAVPVLIMMIFAFGVYAQNQVFGSEVNPLAAVVTGLTLYNGSVVAELVRSGILSLPKGQTEAACRSACARARPCAASSSRRRSPRCSRPSSASSWSS